MCVGKSSNDSCGPLGNGNWRQCDASAPVRAVLDSHVYRPMIYHDQPVSPLGFSRNRMELIGRSEAPTFQVPTAWPRELVWVERMNAGLTGLRGVTWRERRLHRLMLARQRCVGRSALDTFSSRRLDHGSCTQSPRLVEARPFPLLPSSCLEHLRVLAVGGSSIVAMH